MKKGVTINLSNRAVYTLIALTLILIVGVGVYAYGTSTPSTFGHSAGELDVDIDSDGVLDKTLQQAIDAGDIGGGSSLWAQSGSDIYYSNGNVGIGTVTPTQKLDVQGMLKLKHNYGQIGSKLPPCTLSSLGMVAITSDGTSTYSKTLAICVPRTTATDARWISLITGSDIPAIYIQ